MAKPVLLFLHGWKQDHSTWDQVIGNLSDKYQCLAPDLPGFGDNPLPRGGWGVPEYATWISDFMTRQRIESYSVVGHSFGGRVAIVLANKQRKVNKLVLYATPALNPPTGWSWKFTQALVKAVKKSGLPKESIPFYSSIAQQLRSKDRREAGPLTDVFEQVIGFDLKPYLIKIKQPTLLIWGEEDKEVPVTITSDLLEMIKGSELKTIPKTGHFAHIENPGLFCGIIRSWI